MPVEMKLPELGENIEAADVIKVLVSEGDHIAVDDPVVELETNKATVEVPSSLSGAVEAVLVKEGDEVKVGDVLLSVSGEAKAEAPASESPEQASAPRVADAGKALPPAEEPLAAVPAAGRVAAAPSVRTFAREIGIDVSLVSPSGPHSRVSVSDVKRYARTLNQAGSPTAVAGAPPLPQFEKWGKVRRERMSNTRKATAEHLARCWTNVAHVTQFDQADITELESLRKKYAHMADEQGGKLTMAVMVVRIAAAALKAFPKFNASIDMASREVIFKDYINIGIAVATERGLLVPVLRDTDKKNMVQIAVEVSQIAVATREKTVRLEELQGGTFTVTNLGSIGGTHFTPIVNHPEVAILGMGRARTVPELGKNGWEPRVQLPLSLSYDHRLIDGAEGAKFLRWIVEAIEQPLLLSLRG